MFIIVLGLLYIWECPLKTVEFVPRYKKEQFTAALEPFRRYFKIGVIREGCCSLVIVD